MNSSTHDSFCDKIANLYGEVWQKKVKRFSSLRTKRNKLECGLIFIKKCREVGVVPKFMDIKPIKCIPDYKKFFDNVHEKLCSRVIREYYRKIALVSQDLYDLHTQLSCYLRPDLWDTLDAMTYNRAEVVRNKSTFTHYEKLKRLTDKHKQKTVKRHCPTNDDRTVINLSVQELSEDVTLVLSKGLNFAPTPHKVPVETIITSVEDSISRNRLPAHDAECLRQDVASIVRKAKLPRPNISKSEIAALRSLRNNPDLLVLPADKGNATVVLDTVDYERKLKELLDDDVTYKQVTYNPTTRVTAKLRDLLRAVSEDLYARLRPMNPTSPKMYGLPKIHKPNCPLRPIISQIDSPTYKAARFMADVLLPFTGKSTSYVKDSTHFTQLLEGIVLHEDERLVSFDVSSLFTNVPIADSITIIQDLLQDAALPIGYVELINYILTSGYFMWRGDYYLQLEGVAMGSPIAPVVANIFIEWFEDTALVNIDFKPRHWWRYVDDVFAIVHKNHIATLLTHLNGKHPKITFTVESEENGVLPFLDVLVRREQSGLLSHSIYRKPTHTDRYLRADSHHHPSHLASVPRTLINRALRLCGPQYVDAELSHVQHVLETNGYGWRQSFRIANTTTRAKEISVDRAPTFLPYVKGLTDKIGHLLRRNYSIRTIFRPLTQLRQMLRSPKDRDPLGVPGVYGIPCDCGKSYVGETKRNISTRLTEHIRAMKNVDINSTALAEHALVSGSNHYIRFDKARVLAREKFFVPRKIREAIEIDRVPNFNRDRGWAIPPAWKSCLHTSEAYAFENGREDTVSVACLSAPGTSYDTDGNSDDEAPPHVPSTTPTPETTRTRRHPLPPTQPPPRPASRAERALARSHRVACVTERKGTPLE